MALIGVLFSLASVIGGFLVAGGNPAVLVQPSEFIVIIGAGIGAMVASSPGRMKARVFGIIKATLADRIPKRADYLALLTLLFELFQAVRRNGVLALEPHLAQPAQSPLFKKYPAFLKNHHAVPFLTEALEQMVNGVDVNDLDLLLEAEIDTFKEEGHLPVTLLRTVSDSMPGIGIVAAVLGIIVTMGHMDAPPAVIGHHVAAALVGTFLGILICYGVLGPLAGNAELQEVHTLRYLQVMRAGVVASMKGSSPMTAVEFARKTIFSDDRPASKELQVAIDKLKGG